MHLNRRQYVPPITHRGLRPGDGKRSEDREEKAESLGGKRGLEGVGRSC